MSQLTEVSSIIQMRVLEVMVLITQLSGDHLKVSHMFMMMIVYNEMKDVHIGCFCRTAIFYNVVSSVFAVFGLFAGLLLGSQEGLSSWLLSATVGVVIGQR